MEKEEDECEKDLLGNDPRYGCRCQKCCEDRLTPEVRI